MRSKLMSKIFFMVTLFFMLAGCASSPKQEVPSDGEQSNAEVKEGQYIVKFAHNQQVSSPQHKGALEFERLAEEMSNGAIDVQVFPASQLGGMREAVEGTQNGTIEMTQQPTSILTNFSTKFGIVDLPFFWPNSEVLWQVLDGSKGKEIMDTLNEKDLVGFSFWGAGFKQLTANKALPTPADAKGLKFRVMPSPLLTAQFEAWGANAVPMDFGELYNALQQKVIDGQENPLQTINMLKLWEVQKYVTMTNHGYIAYGIVANKAWFESLPEEIQDIIVKAEREAAKKEREILNTEEQGYLEAIKQNGAQVVELTDEQRAQYFNASKPVHAKFAPTIGEDFIASVQAEIDKLQ